MVATAPPLDSLSRGDAALSAALTNLGHAVAAFRLAGRADLAAPLRAAVIAARQAELLRRTGSGELPARDPADWFLDD